MSKKVSKLQQSEMNMPTESLTQQSSSTSSPSKRQFQTPYTYDFRRHPGEYNFGKSLTLPDQALTAMEILKRYANGMPLNVPVKRTAFYGEDVYVPDTKRMDLSEIHDMKNDIASAIKLREEEAKEQLEKTRKKQADLRMEKVIQQRLQEERKKQAAQDRPSTKHLD